MRVLKVSLDEDTAVAVRRLARERYDGLVSMTLRRLIEDGLRRWEVYDPPFTAPRPQHRGKEPEFTAYEQMPRPDMTVVAPRGRSHEIENLRCKNCGWSSHRCKTDPVCAA